MKFGLMNHYLNEAFIAAKDAKRSISFFSTDEKMADNIIRFITERADYKNIIFISSQKTFIFPKGGKLKIEIGKDKWNSDLQYIDNNFDNDIKTNSIPVGKQKEIMSKRNSIFQKFQNYFIYKPKENQ